MNGDNQMNQMPINGQNMSNQSAPSKGPVIGILIIALLIILGGIYILTSREGKDGDVNEPAPIDSPAAREDESMMSDEVLIDNDLLMDNPTIIDNEVMTDDVAN